MLPMLPMFPMVSSTGAAKPACDELRANAVVVTS
jgi:hypothetical protein